MGKAGGLFINLVINTFKFRKGISNSKKDLSSFQKSVQNITKSLAGAFAVREIFNFGKEAFMLAGKLKGVEAAFNNLNDPNLLNNLRRATKGTVSDLELMQQAVKAKNLGLPVKKLGTFFEFARRRAKETGESVEFLTNSIVNGIGRKSPLILDNLGISATKLREEFKKTGDFGKAAANIIESELSSMSDDVDTAAESTAELAATWENFKASLGDADSVAGGFMETLVKGASEAIKGIQTLGTTFQLLTGEVKDLNEKGKADLLRFGEFANGMKLTGLTKQFDRIPFDKLKNNLKQTQKKFTEFAIKQGESAKDANQLWVVYVESRIKAQKQLSTLNNNIINQTEELTDKEKKAALAARNLTLNLEALKDVKLGEYFGNTKEALKQLQDTVDKKKLFLPILVRPEIDQASENNITGAMVERGAAAGKAFGEALEGSIMISVSGIGTAIGTALAGGDMSNVGMSMLQGMSGLLQQFGSQMVALGLGMEALQKSLVLGPLGAGLAIAGGFALIAAGAAIKANLQQQSTGFANGGLVVGSVFGNVGEGRETSRSNPELIMPVDRLNKYLGKNQNGGMGGEVVFRIQGQELMGILNRQQKLNKFS